VFADLAFKELKSSWVSETDDKLRTHIKHTMKSYLKSESKACMVTKILEGVDLFQKEEKWRVRYKIIEKYTH